MTIYNFKEQLKIGEQYENKLDEFFRKDRAVISVGMELQKLGLDRVFIKDDISIGVEYKTDIKAASTGNAFIEVKSVDEKKRGWAKTSLAQILVYYVPDLNIAYIVPMTRIKKNLDKWIEKFETRFCKNEDYMSVGILVPLIELEQIGKKIEID